MLCLSAGDCGAVRSVLMLHCPLRLSWRYPRPTLPLDEGNASTVWWDDGLRGRIVGQAPLWSDDLRSHLIFKYRL